MVRVCKWGGGHVYRGKKYKIHPLEKFGDHGRYGGRPSVAPAMTVRL